ncbi:integrase [Secundilactobacillus kimchicus JCM 15530]|uniref:Integrase n=1 Tax=Secundilactobacillus kimchicus JCM 15530 TaxID=1302272 RepID=A0A0R1HPC4_9LACO|nr:integrase [Secundilactobacillus kimchicus JCM 15530]
MDFHRHIKSALIDALEEDLLDRDPTRKAIIKGVQRRKHKSKFLNQHEMQSLLDVLVLDEGVNWDYFLLLIAKTGLRFAEALALTPKDFDFAHQYLNVSKSWDYKAARSGFAPTKNKSSMRKVQLDWQTVIQFSQLTKDLPDDKPIFVESKVYNDTVNHYLARLCQKAEIPVISVHGLRHTHASLLLYAGVSIASVARRLGHADMTTTQQTYLHIIQELENQDNDKIMKHLASLI